MRNADDPRFHILELAVDILFSPNDQPKLWDPRTRALVRDILEAEAASERHQFSFVLDELIELDGIAA